VKRLIGHRFSDESVQVDIESWPFKVIAGGLEDFPMIVVEEISSMVLEKKKQSWSYNSRNKLQRESSD
jgi:hypothetical protein